MSHLSLFLPPFASDYSGVCSTLFECNCLVVLLDAGCCTRNYVEYDEPRWKSTRRSTFSAQIRTLETTLGDENSIIHQVTQAAASLSPACIALVATPVPAIIGMDIDGLASEIEYECGITTIGLPTNGFDTYENGVSLALEKLVSRFASDFATNIHEASNAAAPATDTEDENSRFRVNLLGETPIDFCLQQNEYFIRYLREHGIAVAFSTMKPFTPRAVARLPEADANIVVSYSGLSAALMLERQFGMPYLPLCPFNSDMAGSIKHWLQGIEQGNVSEAAVIEDHLNMVNTRTNLSPDSCLLLIGDQVAMITVRSMLRRQPETRRIHRPIVVASFFAMDPTLLEQGDFQIADESVLLSFLAQNPRTRVFGDPLLKEIPGIESNRFIERVHQAISSTLFTHDATPLSNEQWEQILQSL